MDICPICGKSFSRLMAHLKAYHYDFYEEECKKAERMFSEGLSLRQIGKSKETFWKFGQALNEMLKSRGVVKSKPKTTPKSKPHTTLSPTALKWDDSVPLSFPLTQNITGSIKKPTDLIKWKGQELSNSFLRTITPEKRDEIAKDLFNYFKNFNWEILKPDDSVVRSEWEKIKRSSLKIDNGKIDNRIAVGSKITSRFFQNIWEIRSGNRPSVLDLIKDEKKLWRVIRNRVGNTLVYCDTAKGSSRYLKGHRKCCEECPGNGKKHQYPMNITPRMIVQGCKASGGATHASIFKPTVAKAIYQKYTKDGSVVLDYSCGFGTRLLGLMATGKKVRYLGYEPNAKTAQGIKEMAGFFGFEGVEIKQTGSEEEIFGEGIVDFAFSSPPYYNAEIYSNDEKDQQCYNLYPNYEDWLEKYWRATIKNIKKMLRDEGILGANVGNFSNDFMIRLKDDMTRIIIEEGFELIDTMSLITSRSHLTNKRKTQNKTKSEPIFFYRKVVER